MTPIKFDEANAKFGPPSDLEESQCATIPAYIGKVENGTCDGADLVVVAWKPDEQEIEAIKNGAPIFLSCLGGLPPHFLTTHFQSATHPR